METIELQSDLREMLEKDAARESKSVNEVVNEAVRRYLQELHQRKLEREIATYEAIHGELKRNYLGKWVAVHEQKLIDSDADRSALYRRVRAKYGEASVLIRQVKEQAIEEFWVRTPSTGKIEK